MLLKLDGSAGARLSAAGAYSLQGSLAHSSGDLKAASRLLHRSEELIHILYQTHPDDMDSVLAMARAFRYLGDLNGGSGMQNLGRSEEAVAYYRQAEQTISRLLDKTQDIRLLKDSRQTLVLLSGAEAALGRTSDAQRDLHKALELSVKIAQDEPDNTLEQLELANASLRNGLLLIDDGKSTDSTVYFSQSAGILEKLSTADPKNALYKRDLAVTENHLAAALRLSGARDKALLHNRKSLSIAEALSAADSKSVEYQADLGISNRKLAETLLALRDGQGALLHSSRSAGILCEISKDSPDAYLQSHCGRALLVKAEAELSTGDLTGALEASQSAERIASKLAKADPLNAVLSSDQARTEAGLGTTYAKLKRIIEARACYRLALELWSALGNRKALTREDAELSAKTRKALSVLPSPTGQ